MTTQNSIYLDNNATTQIDPEVRELISSTMESTYGNPSSIHIHGQSAQRIIDIAREKVAAFMDVELEEIYFTSGGTEADNMAILGHFFNNQDKDTSLIISPVEHKAVVEPCKFLNERFNVPVTLLEVDNMGLIKKDHLESILKKSGTFVSIMTANNDTGACQDISGLSELITNAGAVFHTDAVQAVGRIPLSFKDTAVNMASISSHKIYGPKGAGALYIKRGTRLSSILYGGHQESRRRAGTENVCSIAGFGLACELAKERLAKDTKHISNLKNNLIKFITQQIGNCQIHSNAPVQLPGTINLSFDKIEGETLVMAMDMAGISISNGAACASDSKDPSHVLTAMGISDTVARNSIRISIGRTNTLNDIETAQNQLKAAVDRLRNLG